MFTQSYIHMYNRNKERTSRSDQIFPSAMYLTYHGRLWMAIGANASSSNVFAAWVCMIGERAENGRGAQLEQVHVFAG